MTILVNLVDNPLVVITPIKIPAVAQATIILSRQGTLGPRIQSIRGMYAVDLRHFEPLKSVRTVATL